MTVYGLPVTHELGHCSMVILNCQGFGLLPAGDEHPDLCQEAETQGLERVACFFELLLPDAVCGCGWGPGGFKRGRSPFVLSFVGTVILAGSGELQEVPAVGKRPHHY